MSRLETTPISQKDIKDFLTKTEDDFRLELEAYQACRANGLNVCHGGTYEDPVTKKTRQFDVRASRVKDGRKIQLAVECKCLKNFYPLLILQTPRTSDECYHEIVYSYSQENLTPITSPSAESGRVSRGNKFYKEAEFVGKSTSRVGRNANTKEFISDDSELFDKWSQALGSAHELIARSAEYHEKYGLPDFFAVTFPALVVSDGTLWTVNFRSDGKRMPPTRSDEATIYIGKDYWTGPLGITHTISHLHVFTLKGFKHFINRIAADDDPNEYIWSDLFPRDTLEKLRDGERD